VHRIKNLSAFYTTASKYRFLYKKLHGLFCLPGPLPRTALFPRHFSHEGFTQLTLPEGALHGRLRTATRRRPVHHQDRYLPFIALFSEKLSAIFKKRIHNPLD
jgi:hypothetical protein